MTIKITLQSGVEARAQGQARGHQPIAQCFLQPRGKWGPAHQFEAPNQANSQASGPCLPWHV